MSKNNNENTVVEQQNDPIEHMTELEKHVAGDLGEPFIEWLVESHYLPDDDRASFRWTVCVNGNEYQCSLQARIERIN